MPTCVRGCPSQNAGSTMAGDAGRGHRLVVVGGARRHVDVRDRRASWRPPSSSRSERDVGRDASGRRRGARSRSRRAMRASSGVTRARRARRCAPSAHAGEQRLQHHLVEARLGKVRGRDTGSRRRSPRTPAARSCGRPRRRAARSAPAPAAAGARAARPAARACHPARSTPRPAIRARPAGVRPPRGGGVRTGRARRAPTRRRARSAPLAAAAPSPASPGPAPRVRPGGLPARTPRRNGCDRAAGGPRRWPARASPARTRFHARGRRRGGCSPSRAGRPPGVATAGSIGLPWDWSRQ